MIDSVQIMTVVMEYMDMDKFLALIFFYFAEM